MSGTEEPQCWAVVEQMHLFFDDELTTSQAHVVRLHLAECAECEESFDAEVAFRAAIQRCRCDQPAPETLRARVVRMHVRRVGDDT